MWKLVKLSNLPYLPQQNPCSLWISTHSLFIWCIWNWSSSTKFQCSHQIFSTWSIFVYAKPSSLKSQKGNSKDDQKFTRNSSQDVNKSSGPEIWWLKWLKKRFRLFKGTNFLFETHSNLHTMEIQSFRIIHIFFFLFMTNFHSREIFYIVKVKGIFIFALRSLRLGIKYSALKFLDRIYLYSLGYLFPLLRHENVWFYESLIDFSKVPGFLDFIEYFPQRFLSGILSEDWSRKISKFDPPSTIYEHSLLLNQTNFPPVFTHFLSLKVLMETFHFIYREIIYN